MRNIEDYVSTLVENQFPAFYKDDGPNFILFVQEYFKYLEAEGNTLYYSRNLLEYRDIDKTIDSFVVHFKEKYLKYFPFELAIEDARFLIKHIMDFYRSKGSERSYEIFFKSVYNTTPEFYYPKEDIFKLSDGTWYKPEYLEVSPSLNTPLLKLKQITGSITGARAFVEDIITKRINGRYVEVLYLSNVEGTFSTGEIVTIESNPLIEGFPVVVGSLSSVDIITGGQNFNVGDILNIVTGSGKGGKIRVTQVSTETGIVEFELIDGGFGFTSNSQVLVSTKVLDLLANAANLDLFTQMKQPLANIQFVSANNALFANGQVLESWFSNGSLAGNAVILSVGYSGANTGTILVSPRSGNVANGNYTSSGLFFNQGNTAKALVNVFTNVTASANMMGSNATSIGVINITNTFVNYDNNYILGNIVGKYFHANDDINSSTDFITILQNPFSNNDVVFYQIDTGNTGLTNLLNGESYFVVQSNTSGVKLSLSSNGSAIDLSNGLNEFGHSIFKYGVNTSITSIGVGTGATFKVGGISNPETVRVDSTFIRGTNFANVGYLNIRLNEQNANATPTVDYEAQFNANTAVDSATDFITLTSNQFVNNDVVYYSVSSGNTALTNLSSGRSYWVVEANSTGVKLANTRYGWTTTTSFNTNLDVDSANDFIITYTNPFANGDVVQYRVESGNTALTGLSANTKYFIVQANTIGVKLAATSGGANINITANTVVSESGHSLSKYDTINLTSGLTQTGHFLRKEQGLGFPKKPTGGMDTILLNAFDISDVTIGTVSFITSINGGQDYTKSPFVRIFEYKTAGYDKHDHTMVITNAAGGFGVGDLVTQTSNGIATILTVNNFTGNSSIAAGEFIYQSNGTANVATGYVYISSIASNVGTITVANVVGTFVNTFQVQTLTTVTTSNVVTVNSTATITSTGKGQVISSSVINATAVQLELKRLSFFDVFAAGNTIVADSGATGQIASVVPILTTMAIGDNANVTSNVVVAPNTVVTADIYNSGFGYIEDEIVSANSSTQSITIKLHSQTQGIGEGVYKDNKGFSSSDKYLQDGEYYQNYSYEIQSRVPLDKYSEVLKQVIHVAGTKMFARLVDITQANLQITSNSVITQS